MDDERAREQQMWEAAADAAESAWNAVFSRRKQNFTPESRASVQSGYILNDTFTGTNGKVVEARLYPDRKQTGTFVLQANFGNFEALQELGELLKQEGVTLTGGGV